MSAYVPAARREDLLYQVLDEHLQTFLAESKPSIVPWLLGAPWSSAQPANHFVTGTVRG